MTNRHGRRARSVRVAPPRLRTQLDVWARGIEALAPSAFDKALSTAPAIRVELFTVIAELTDVIRARRFRDDLSELAVAKPFTLRGANATRTVNNEDQVILPAYGANDLIAAVYVPGGALGIVDAADTVAVHWLDLNVDARQWAEDIV